MKRTEITQEARDRAKVFYFALYQNSIADINITELIARHGVARCWLPVLLQNGIIKPASTRGRYIVSKFNHRTTNFDSLYKAVKDKNKTVRKKPIFSLEDKFKMIIEYAANVLKL